MLTENQENIISYIWLVGALTIYLTPFCLHFAPIIYFWCIKKEYKNNSNMVCFDMDLLSVVLVPVALFWPILLIGGLILLFIIIITKGLYLIAFHIREYLWKKLKKEIK